MSEHPFRSVSGEYLEKGRESESAYREFDDLGESRQKILTLIADRIRAENASAEYQKIAAQTASQAVNKGCGQTISVNFRA